METILIKMKKYAVREAIVCRFFAQNANEEGGGEPRRHKDAKGAQRKTKMGNVARNGL
jgi:hypothetical protein